MYVYVAVEERESYYSGGPGCGRIKARLEQASGEPCLIVPYQEFNRALVEELRPRAIAMSGFGGHFQNREVGWFLGMDEVLREVDLPMLAFCGSHQFLGFAYNRDLPALAAAGGRLEDEPMRKLAPEAEGPRRAGDLAEYFMADGFYQVRRVREDPLFAGLPEVMTMRCSHYCEVKQLPPGFVRLAESGHCAIEAMRHETRPLYGVQFHPEAYEEPWGDGRRVLENFAAIAREFRERRATDAAGR